MLELSKNDSQNSPNPCSEQVNIGGSIESIDKFKGFISEFSLKFLSFYGCFYGGAAVSRGTFFKFQLNEFFIV